MKIKLEKISKSFNSEQIVLSDVNLDDDIQTLAIIGPSGGGKSTLLRIVGGLLYPDAGQLLIDDKLVTFNEKELLQYRKELGFVFQNGGLFFHLTALENITVPLVKVHHYTQKEADKLAIELLTRFGLKDDMYKRPAELSGGQQQRVAIVRAVAAKPKMILLDEPTSALDPEYTNEVLDTINELKKEGMSFIIVTHEIGFARQGCEKVAFLKDGKLMEYGLSEEVFTNPKTKELQQFLSKLLEWN